MLLEADGVRSDGATTIYRDDVDTVALTEQLRNAKGPLGDKLKAAIDNGDMSLSIREPTQNLLAALVADITAFDARFDRIMVMTRDLAEDMGLRIRDVELDIGNRKLGFNIESEIPSAYKKQISYDVSSLP